MTNSVGGWKQERGKGGGGDKTKVAVKLMLFLPASIVTEGRRQRSKLSVTQSSLRLMRGRGPAGNYRPCLLLCSYAKAGLAEGLRSFLHCLCCDWSLSKVWLTVI